jgi:hypothetical protein
MKLGVFSIALIGLAALSAAHAAPPQVTKTECAYADGATMGDMRSLPVQASAQSGYAVHAAKGVMTCSPRAAGKTMCQANGASKLLIALQTDFWFVTIPAGRTATVTVTETAQPTCFLNK